MDRSLPLFVIGLILGGGLGFAIAAASGFTFDDHDHSNPAHHRGANTDHGGMGHHGPINLSGPDAPQVSISVTADPFSGFNLHVMLRNFTFAPAQAGRANVDGVGHAHLYINGVKHSRVYGPWVHLDDLPKGAVQIEVSLNANDHRPLAVDGTVIAARTQLTVE